MRVALFLRQISGGGAERQAALLARGLGERGWVVAVFVFYGDAILQRDLERAGVRVVSLDKKGRWDNAAPIVRLKRALEEFQPDVLYTFLDVPNILGVLLTRSLPQTRLVWGIRNTSMRMSDEDSLQWIASWAERLLARKARLLISNSIAGREYVLRWRTSVRKVCVIANGIDTARFRPNSDRPPAHPGGSGSDGRGPTVGVVARLHPMKGHSILLRTAAELIHKVPGVRFVFVGAGAPSFEQRLRGLAANHGLDQHICWVKPQDDVEVLYGGFDLLCLPSVYGEGFPNVIGEAMASGIPCVVTNVGDSAPVVGDTGWVVPPGDSESLSRALLEALTIGLSDRLALGVRARQRIIDNFSFDRMIVATMNALACL